MRRCDRCGREVEAAAGWQVAVRNGAHTSTAFYCSDDCKDGTVTAGWDQPGVGLDPDAVVD